MKKEQRKDQNNTAKKTRTAKKPQKDAKPEGPLIKEKIEPFYSLHIPLAMKTTSDFKDEIYTIGKEAIPAIVDYAFTDEGKKSIRSKRSSVAILGMTCAKAIDLITITMAMNLHMMVESLEDLERQQKDAKKILPWISITFKDDGVDLLSAITGRNIPKASSQQQMVMNFIHLRNADPAEQTGKDLFECIELVLPHLEVKVNVHQALVSINEAYLSTKDMKKGNSLHDLSYLKHLLNLHRHAIDLFIEDLPRVIISTRKKGDSQVFQTTISLPGIENTDVTFTGRTAMLIVWRTILMLHHTEEHMRSLTVEAEQLAKAFRSSSRRYMDLIASR